LSSVTYSVAGRSTNVVLSQRSVGLLEVKTCFCVPLMKLANGSTSEVGQ
jgi:hypothetical protein